MKIELTKLMQALARIIIALMWPLVIGSASCFVAYFGTIIWAMIFGPPELAEQGPVFNGMAAGLIGFIIGIVITIIRARKSRDHD
ncbi:MAG: hypothetical protein JSV17_07965 [Candidatus Aminicenantes bacterium]|nr:MAG: hypothetical protein JSV17_07965 [Candidatus Aminicenantes bacterium]